MKQSIYISIVFLLIVIIFSTCAQRGGYSPVGVTGGSDGGYGYSKDYYRESSYYYGDEVLHGVWTNNNETLVLATEGLFELKSDEEIRVGIYTKSEDNLTLKEKDGLSITYKFLVTETRLILEISE